MNTPTKILIASAAAFVANRIINKSYKPKNSVTMKKNTKGGKKRTATAARKAMTAVANRIRKATSKIFARARKSAAKATSRIIKSAKKRVSK